MIYWAQLLHFYQPPTQIPSMLTKICDESYRPLIEVFNDNPHARATINFNGVLTDMLMDCGHKDIIDGYKHLAARGQLEMTGSAMYHPILPLIPEAERVRQIRINTAVNRRLFGDIYNPKGFFPPEMCYSQDIVPPIIQSGFEWIILGGIACPDEWPVDILYQTEQDGHRLVVFFRDDVLSNKISFQDLGPKDFIAHLMQQKGKSENMYVVTAMDAETFGHHIQDWERAFLGAVYNELDPLIPPKDTLKQTKVLANQHTALLSSSDVTAQIKMVTISELLHLFPIKKVVNPKPSSWSTTSEDLAADNPYPLWYDRNNEIHRLQWEHLSLCIQLVNKALDCADNKESKHFAAISRRLLDRAEHSCQLWWASHRPMWDINLIHMGMLDQFRVLVNAYRAINKSSVDEKVKQEYYYLTVASRDIRSKLTDRLFVQ
jgi:alpha-amylase/alpha-mannosidase (GH57 family)